MSQYPANGISIEAETFGDPKHPAIVLIMGLGCQLVVWPVALCEALAAAGFHVVRFDNRDIGLSEKIKGERDPQFFKNILRSKLGLRVRAPYKLADMALDTLGLMDALGIQRAHIVGLSMGGMIAQTLALDHVDRLLSLTSIMSSSNNPRLPQASLKVQKRLVRRPKSKERDALIDHGAETWMVLASPHAVPSEAERRMLATLSVDRSIYPRGYIHQLLAILASGSRHKRLPEIKLPTLVIHGEDDPLVPVAAGYEQAKLIPGAKIEVLKHMGHDLPAPLLPRIATLITKHANAATA
ncbi:MAG: alpha/beta fold hydrolase [Stagnimonas sp.]|nr:alpha/beta fold hydrolase [Stagnimonas sp.]